MDNELGKFLRAVPGQIKNWAGNVGAGVGVVGDVLRNDVDAFKKQGQTSQLMREKYYPMVENTANERATAESDIMGNVRQGVGVKEQKQPEAKVSKGSMTMNHVLPDGRKIKMTMDLPQEEEGGSPSDQFVQGAQTGPQVPTGGQPQNQDQTQQYTPQNLQEGIMEWSKGNKVPLANYVDELVQAGQGLPDPLAPVILAIMETGGGQKMASENNLYNLGPGIEYPDMGTAIVGGGPNDQRGFKGVINGPIYADYRQSGDIKDLFKHFTPDSDPNNPKMGELVGRYNQIREYFLQ